MNKTNIIFYKLIFYTVIITLFQSCFNSKEGSINECTKRVSLYKFKKQISPVEFDLDSATSGSLECLKIKEIDGKVLLTFLNTYNNSIYCYNYNTKKIDKKIVLPLKDINSFEIISWDSIISYQYWKQKIFLHNEAGKIIDEITVPLENNKSGYCAQPSSISPITYRNNKLYLAGGIATFEKANDSSHSVAEVDLSSKKYKYKLKFPKIYSDYFFGGMHYNVNIPYLFNDKDKLFVFSFPASHNIISTQDFVNFKEECAGSKYIKNIPEYPYKGDDKSYEYVTENGLYYSILYDKYNDLYYRLCLLPLSKEKENSNTKKDLSIIILDNKFKIVGEQIFKEGQDFFIENLSSVFVAPDGLLFQKKANINDEARMSFIKYKIIKE